MSQEIHGGHTVPRDGTYKKVVHDPEVPGRRVLIPIQLKVGEVFPGEEENVYEVGQLRSGDLAPKDGVYHNSGESQRDYPLKAGEKFPAANPPAEKGGPPDPIDPATDFIWVRDLE